MSNINKLINSGYKYNKKTKKYEKIVKIKTKKGMQKVTLNALKLPELDDTGKSTEIIYIIHVILKKIENICM